MTAKVEQIETMIPVGSIVQKFSCECSFPWNGFNAFIEGMRRYPRSQRCDERGTRCSSMQRDKMPSPTALVAFVQVMGGRSSANTRRRIEHAAHLLDNRSASIAQLQDCNHCGNAVEIFFKVGPMDHRLQVGETKSLVTPRGPSEL